jgi:hypothetical protein
LGGVVHEKTDDLEHGQHIKDQTDLGLDAQSGRHFLSQSLQKIITYSVIVEVAYRLRCR